MPRLTGAKREARDKMIIDLFLTGYTQQAIAKHPRVRLTAARVNQIINTELEQAQKDQVLRNEKAAVIYMARIERLVQLAFEHADEGELKAIEVARRVMEQQAKAFGWTDDIIDAGAPVPPMSDTELDDGEPLDELARYRAQRAT